MNEYRVKNIFGKRRFNSDRFGKERELNNASAQDYIILQPEKPKSKAKVVFLVLGAFLVLVGSIVAGVLALRQKEDYSDAYLIEVIGEYGADVVDAQDLMELFVAYPKWYNGFFSDENLASIERSFGSVSKFYQKIEGIKAEKIKSELARDLFVKLRDNLSENHYIYDEALDLYAKIFDYIKSGNDFENLAHDTDGDLIFLYEVFTGACANYEIKVDDCRELWPNTLPGEFVVGVFSRYETDTYLDLDYSDVLGRIGAIIKDFGGER